MCDQACWLRRMALLLLLAVGVSLGLIAAGALDPRPYGSVIWREKLPLQALPAKTRRLLWLDVGAPAEAYSLRLTASLHEGDTDIGYGLAIGDDKRFLTAMVSPLGYVALCFGDAGTSLPASRLVECPLPWQVWPHVRSDRARNEIWIDVDSDRILVRINREWLWQGTVSDLGHQIGWIGETFAGPAVIDNGAIYLFADQGE
jgi:hypothetical protein